MKRAYGLSMALILVAACGTLALAQASGRTGGKEDIARTVSVLDHVWLDAAYNHDTGTMAWLFTDNFVEVHPGGEIVNKQQQLDQIEQLKPGGGLQALHPDDIQVRYASSDVAFLTDTTMIQGGGSSGPQYSGQYRVIRVFVKQNGRWRAAGAGITHLAPQ